MVVVVSGTTRVSRYQKCKTNLDFTEARDSEWHWHQLGHMQVCTSLQTSTGCPSCRPTTVSKHSRHTVFTRVSFKKSSEHNALKTAASYSVLSAARLLYQCVFADGATNISFFHCI